MTKTIFSIIVASAILLGAGYTSNQLADAASGFSGDYDPVNWTFTTDSDGFVITSQAPARIILQGGDNGSKLPGDTDYTLTVACGGVISFDWIYQTTDEKAEWDPAGYLVNGGFTQLTIDDFELSFEPPINQTGTTSVTVSTGDTFGYRVHTVDNLFGFAAFTHITNLQTPDCNTPPVVTASLEPICDDDDEGLFRVVFDATGDNTPLNVEALINGVVPVSDGDIVELELDDEFEWETEDGITEIEGESFTLDVTVTDSQGQAASASASPSFDQCGDDDDEDDDDEDDDDEDDDDEDEDD